MKRGITTPYYFVKYWGKKQLIPRESFGYFFQQLQIPETMHKIKGV